MARPPHLSKVLVDHDLLVVLREVLWRFGLLLILASFAPGTFELTFGEQKITR